MANSYKSKLNRSKLNRSKLNRSNKKRKSSRLRKTQKNNFQFDAAKIHPASLILKK